MKKKLFVLCTICFMFLFSGCELFDVLEDAINKYWGAPSRVDVLILPPYPYFPGDKETTEWSRLEAEAYSENIKNALKRGIDTFNNESRRTKIIPNYFMEKDIVKAFYEDFFEACNKDGDKDGDREVRKRMKEILDVLNRRKKDRGMRNFECVICGMYEYKAAAQANKIDLVHFDKEKYTLVQWSGVVRKESGNAQDSDLESLMTALLKKAYGK